MNYIFDWDPGKDRSNSRKHGVTFDEARSVFRDPLCVLLLDPAHSVAEKRYLVLGLFARHRLLVVAFAERPTHTRLISARRANRRERRRYEEEGQ